MNIHLQQMHILQHRHQRQGNSNLLNHGGILIQQPGREVTVSEEVMAHKGPDNYKYKE